MPFAIQLSDITNSTTSSDGTGVFDVLTQSIVKHIEAQYDAGRLDGTDYANVYLGSIQSVLAESVRFVLSEKQSSEQAALIAQQILSETKQNEINGLLDLQKIRLEKETALIIRQESELALSGTLDRLFTTEKTLATTSGATDNTNKTTSDIALTSAQELKVDAEKILVDSQNSELSLNGVSQRLVNDAQISKSGSDKLLVDSQKSELELNGVSQRLTNSAQVLKINSDVTVNSSQIDKLSSEKILIDSQKDEISPNAISQREINSSQVSKLDAEQIEIPLNGVSQRLVNTGQIDKILSDKLLIDAQESEIAANALSQRSVATSGITVDVAQVSKVGSEKVLVDSQNSELLLNGTSQRLVNTAQISKIVADEVLTGSQNSELLLNGTSQRLVNTSQISKVDNETLFVTEQITSESKNNEAGGIIDLNKIKIQEDIDLSVSQTALQYEQINSSQSDTTRKNALNSKEVLHKVKETALVTRQESELSLTGIEERLFTVQKTSSTASSTVDSTNKTAADISLSTSQKLKTDADKILTESQNTELGLNGTSQRLVNSSQVIKIGADKVLVDSQNTELLQNGTSQRLVNTAQIAKVAKETLFINEQIASETKNNEIGGVIDLTKLKIQEGIDLTIAQTSTQFEQVLSSQSETVRRNSLNSKDVVHRGKETDLVIRQESELSLSGISQREKTTSENTLLNSRNVETLAATTRTDSESAQRVLLMSAQTVGFKTDAKQKLMRQLFEGYAVNVTTSGAVSNPPVGSTGTALDNIANDILDDLGSGVNV
mgnify:CR=1 FL=1